MLFLKKTFRLAKDPKTETEKVRMGHLSPREDSLTSVEDPFIPIVDFLWQTANFSGHLRVFLDRQRDPHRQRAFLPPKVSRGPSQATISQTHSIQAERLSDLLKILSCQ